MALQNFFATKTSSSPLGSGDTTITLLTPPTVFPGRLVLEPKSPTNREVIYYTGVLGNQITGVTRGQGGTTAKPHAASVAVQMNVLAEDIKDVTDAFNLFVANTTDWRTIVGGVVSTTNKIFREFDVVVPGDVRGYLDVKHRIKATRTTAPVANSVRHVWTNNQGSVRVNASVVGITFTDDWTCSAWIWIESYTGYEAYIITRSSTSGWGFHLNPGGQLRLWGWGREVASVAAMPQRTWIHVAGTMDMSANSGLVYMNGMALWSNMTNAATSITNVGDISIGARANNNNGTISANSGFHGYIRDVRVYNKVRTQAEILSDMYGHPPSTTNLVGWWKMEETSGTTLADSSGNGNTLTLAAGAAAPTLNQTDFALGLAPYNQVNYGIVVKKPTYDSGTNRSTITVAASATSTFDQNQTYSSIQYSTADTPVGFPSDPKLWSHWIWTITNWAQPGDGAYRSTGISIYAPTGLWRTYHDFQIENNSASSGSVMATISPNVNSNTPVTSKMWSREYKGWSGHMITPSLFWDTILITSPHYWYQTMQGDNGTVGIRNDFRYGYITLENALL